MLYSLSPRKRREGAFPFFREGITMTKQYVFSEREYSILARLADSLIGEMDGDIETDGYVWVHDTLIAEEVDLLKKIVHNL